MAADNAALFPLAWTIVAHEKMGLLAKRSDLLPLRPPRYAFAHSARRKSWPN